MQRSQAKRIEEIVRTQDVRDPRQTLDAIAAILAEKPSIKPEPSDFEKLMAAMMASADETEDEIPHLVPENVEEEFGNPVAVIRIYNTKPVPGNLNVGVVIEACDNHIEPRHFSAVKLAIQAFATEKVNELAQTVAAQAKQE